MQQNTPRCLGVYFYCFAHSFRAGFLAYTLLICDIQLPFGRHHVNRDLFAPRGSKFDCYWHEFFDSLHRFYCGVVPLDPFNEVRSTFTNGICFMHFFRSATMVSSDPCASKHGHNGPQLLGWCSIYTTTQCAFFDETRKYNCRNHQH